MALPNYSCAQSELYTTCRNAWLLCQQYLSNFTDYKSKYNPTFIAENLALITTVEAMPDNAARTAPVKGLRKDLVNEKADASAFYVRLKGYVTEAFKDDTTVLEAMYTEIGKSYFDKLGTGDWDNVSGLFSSMLSVIRKHEGVLSVKGYMPANFLSRIEDKEATYTAAHQSWDNGYNATPEATEAKVVANNDLKTRVMAMLTDGQAAFVDNKPIALKFVWTTLLADVRGVKPMGLGGKIIDKATEAPLSNVIGTIESLNMTVTCDKDGRYQFVVPTADKLTIVFKCEGYKPLVVTDRNVKTNVMGRLNVAMEAV